MTRGSGAGYEGADKNKRRDTPDDLSERWRVEDGVLGLMARIVKQFFGRRRSGVQISARDCMHKRLAVYARISSSIVAVYIF